jgi:hypothetical protein
VVERGFLGLDDEGGLRDLSDRDFGQPGQ